MNANRKTRVRWKHLLKVFLSACVTGINVCLETVAVLDVDDFVGEVRRDGGDFVSGCDTAVADDALEPEVVDIVVASAPVTVIVVGVVLAFVDDVAVVFVVFDAVVFVVSSLDVLVVVVAPFGVLVVAVVFVVFAVVVFVVSSVEVLVVVVALDNVLVAAVVFVVFAAVVSFVDCIMNLAFVAGVVAVFSVVLFVGFGVVSSFCFSIESPIAIYY